MAVIVVSNYNSKCLFRKKQAEKCLSHYFILVNQFHTGHIVYL